MKFSEVCAAVAMTIAAGASVLSAPASAASAGDGPQIVRTQAAEGVTTCTIERVFRVWWKWDPNGKNEGFYDRGQTVDTYNYGWDSNGLAYYQGDPWGAPQLRGIWIPAYAFGKPCFG